MNSIPAVSSRPRKVLNPPDTHYVRAAEGWLELGCVNDAMAEINHITLEGRFHPRVLVARWEVAARQGQWEMAYTLAQGLIVLVPGEPAGWINRSIALHAMRRTPEAWYGLLSAAEKFPQNVVVAYNLACYACQLGKFPEANSWLKKAGDIDKENRVKWMALKDPDLQPLWEHLGRPDPE